MLDISYGISGKLAIEKYLVFTPENRIPVHGDTIESLPGWRARYYVRKLKTGRENKIGGQPAGVVGVGDIAILDIEEIDKPAQTVKLKAANGGTFLYKTRHPENLDFVHRGDKVVVKVAEAIAAKVTKKSL